MFLSSPFPYESAIVYECMNTVTRIYPSAQLVEFAARSVGRFLRSENNNLKYLGITALTSIVKVKGSICKQNRKTNKQIILV